MVNIDIRKAGEEMQSLFCMKKRQEFWEILDAALAEADCKSVCPVEFREWLDETDFFTPPASTKCWLTFVAWMQKMSPVSSWANMAAPALSHGMQLI